MRRVVSILLVVLFILPLHGASLAPATQEISDAEVEAILSRMTSTDRVGQLFLVTYYGNNIGPESDIDTLIRNYRIGGVVIRPENDNIPEGEKLPESVFNIATELQATTADRSQSPPTDVPGPPLAAGPFVPLFVSLEFRTPLGASESSIERTLYPLSSNLATGATWNPENARVTGEIVGTELSAIGINLLMGPSADVVEQPVPQQPSGDLGTIVFGGEPYWVSQMTAAYVTGVHQGSGGRIAVAPMHFPGHGGADRHASVEIPTIRRSLDQLRQVDLQPFYAVTGYASDPEAQADGIVTGHIRYQGFQGENPRLSTSPISLDGQALRQLLELEPINEWRLSGGLTITDELGLAGVRKSYPLQDTLFLNRQIAQDAFLAGNDVLFLGAFGDNPPVDQMLSVTDTIEFFQRRYEDDPAFQQRVDDAVRRIIRKKLELYGEFSLDAVLTSSSGLDTVGAHSEETLTIAEQSATLLSPLNTDLVPVPQTGERIVVFSDGRTQLPCTLCDPVPVISTGAFQSAVLRQYGPEGSGQVSLANIQSYTLEQLESYLEFGPIESVNEEETPTPNAVGFALDSADWIVFVTLDSATEVPGSSAVQRFLAELPAESSTEIVVMEMGAPYYLDSTEISKLTAYYAFYSHSRLFIDVAARALFQGTSVSGASPVTVDGLNYDILEATSPDPDQILQIVAEVQGTDNGDAEATEQPFEPRLGDTLLFRTEPILDQNSNPVPDGTPVQFILSYNDVLQDVDPCSDSKRSGADYVAHRSARTTHCRCN